ISKAHVLREGGIVAVPAGELVPGDVAVLTAGDRIPADARLFEVASLRVNEASLTGESLPVSKAVEALPRDSFLGDRKNMVFMGTAVDGGRGKAVIVETGMATQLGKIAGLVQQETKEETPLQKQLDRLGRQIGIAVLLAAGLIFVIGVLRELPGLDASHVELLFLTAVGLSVAAIPEGLPAIVTISLALGLQRMIRRHALIRKLPAVEALGAASVICSDKTGTLPVGGSGWPRAGRASIRIRSGPTCLASRRSPSPRSGRRCRPCTRNCRNRICERSSPSPKESGTPASRARAPTCL